MSQASDYKLPSMLHEARMIAKECPWPSAGTRQVARGVDYGNRAEKSNSEADYADSASVTLLLHLHFSLPITPPFRESSTGLLRVLPRFTGEGVKLSLRFDPC